MRHGQSGGLLALGLGNPIRCDDAIGWRVIEHAESLWDAASLTSHGEAVTFRTCSAAGLALIDEFAGFDRLIVVDAYHADDARPGRVRSMDLADLGDLGRGMLSAHSINLSAALTLGRLAGYDVPGGASLVLVDVSDNCFVFGEQMCAAVARAVPEAAGVLVGVIVEQRARGRGRRNPCEGEEAERWNHE